MRSLVWALVTHKTSHVLVQYKKQQYRSVNLYLLIPYWNGQNLTEWMNIVGIALSYLMAMSDKKGPAQKLTFHFKKIESYFTESLAADLSTLLIFLFVWFDSLRPSSHFLKLCGEGSPWVESVQSKD